MWGMATPDDIDQLFVQTLSGEYDDDAPWDAVRRLQVIGSLQVFEIAAKFCTSNEEIRRARGVDVLAQLGLAVSKPHTAPAQARDVIVTLLQNELSKQVIESSVYALGHLTNLENVEIITKFANHSDAGVRHAVAFALSGYDKEDDAISCLIKLMDDKDENVRDWATFGLGVLGEADTPAIRDALFSRLDDPHLETRAEAMLGMANRRDLRVLPSLLGYFEDGWISSPAVEAATAILGLKEEPVDWKPSDYAKALRRL